MFDLWYSIIHSAKRLPFRDTAGLHKLVTLMSAMKAQSALFHDLGGFTGEARESINNSPGYGSGYLPPEAHDHANMQYFFALLTRSQVADFCIYCFWAMRSALETPHKDDRQDQGVQVRDSLWTSTMLLFLRPLFGSSRREGRSMSVKKILLRRVPGRVNRCGRVVLSLTRSARHFGRAGSVRLRAWKSSPRKWRGVAREAAEKMEEIERESWTSKSPLMRATLTFNFWQAERRPDVRWMVCNMRKLAIGTIPGYVLLSS